MEMYGNIVVTITIIGALKILFQAVLDLFDKSETRPRFHDEEIYDVENMHFCDEMLLSVV